MKNKSFIVLLGALTSTTVISSCVFVALAIPRFKAWDNQHAQEELHAKQVEAQEAERAKQIEAKEYAALEAQESARAQAAKSQAALQQVAPHPASPQQVAQTKQLALAVNTQAAAPQQPSVSIASQRSDWLVTHLHDFQVRLQDGSFTHCAVYSGANLEYKGVTFSNNTKFVVVHVRQELGKTVTGDDAPECTDATAAVAAGAAGNTLFN